MPNKRVLIVDDDTHTNSMISESLKMENYNVLQAHTGEKALELLQTEKVDLILLDLMLPGLKGWQVAEELQKNPNTAKIPVMLISILPPEDTTIAEKNSSVMAYVCKPFDLDTLLGEVKKIIT